MSWSAPTSKTEAYCRAGGRRAYNARRRQAKQQRRAWIICRLAGVPHFWGLQKRLAAEFGVSKSTISRDFEAIRNADKGALLK